MSAGPVTVRAITSYPVKSMRGVPHAEARVGRRGLDGDRRWLVQDDAGTFLTGREAPRLVLVEARLVEGGVELRAPGVAPIVARPVGARRDALVWKTSSAAIDAGDEVAAWLTRWLGRPARLVHQPDDAARAINPLYAREGDELSFADAYPVLLASTSSLADLQARIAATDAPATIDMRRFRPNVVVDGAAPFAEDGWKIVRIGEARLRATKLCDRCVFTTIDPDTAAGGKEPLRTLASYRRWDDNVWFGLNLVPLDEGRIRVGDPLVIEA